MSDAARNAPPVLGSEFAGACDSHVHIYDPRFAYVPGADLQPPLATVADYRQLQRQLGTSRTVVVQPSSYGTDNRCTLEAVAQLGDSARAVVVIDADAPESLLAEMHAQGARGVRFNLLRPSSVAAACLSALAARVASAGWHVQLHAGPEQIVALADVLASLSAPVVFDHLGRLPRLAGYEHRAFSVVTRLLEDGRAWVKLSGAELDCAQDAPLYAPAAELAARFIALAPERVVWGSNWPHPAIHPQGHAWPDDAALLRWLQACAPDRAAQHRILVSNPARLYGFGR